MTTRRIHDERVASPRVSLAVAGVAAAVFVVVAALVVPWSWLPGGTVQPVTARSVFSPEQIASAEAYSSAQRYLGWASLAVSTVLALALGLTRAGAGSARRIRGPWWVRTALVTAALLVLGELATLPMALRIRHNRLRYGLSEQSLAGWVRDEVTSLLVSWVFMSVLALLVVGLARRSPRRWPLWAAVAGVALTVLGSFVYPVVVEPLFNSFTSLPDGRLRTDVLRLAESERVPVRDVLVADASRRTTTLNAYVSGLGQTRRVVLYDNLVRDEPRRVVLSVVGHELGHARQHDVLVGTLLGATGAAAGFGLLGLLLGSRRLLDRAGVRDPGQPEVVALVLALATVGSLAASPVQNTISRAVEARADRATLRATGDYSAFDRLQKQLAARSLSDPTPPRWSQFWFGSHPTALQRIGLADALQEKDPR